MQLQGFILMIFTFVIVPVFILFSNHNMFFIVMALVLLFSIFRTLYIVFSGYKKGIPKISKEDQDLMEEFELSMDYDFRRLDTGFRVAKYAISILFYLYCSFYVDHIFIKILISFIIVYWVYYIINTIKINDIFRLAFSQKKYQRVLAAIINSAAAIVIVIAAYNKLRW